MTFQYVTAPVRRYSSRAMHIACAATMTVSVVATLAIVHFATPQTAPRDTILVGTQCEGPSPIAVAYDEDLLPICAAIDVHEITGIYGR